MNTSQEIAVEFFERLLGSPGGLAEVVAADVTFNSPRAGQVVGRDAVLNAIDAERDWMIGLGAGLDQLRQVKTTADAKRVVHEVTFDLDVAPMPRPIKFAVVCDLDGDAISALRVYYSYIVLSGDRSYIRPALLPVDDTLRDRIPPPVRTYVEGIASANFEVWKLFAEGATFTGATDFAFGGSALVRFFAIATAHEGGIPLQMGTVTADDRTCAIEENLGSWGSIEFAHPTAGLAVYDYDDEGYLTAARIYDDIPDNPISRPGYAYKYWDEISAAAAAAGFPSEFVPGPNTTAPELVAGFILA